MSPMRSEYREFGLELVSLDHSCCLKRPPMAEEKRDDGAGDPIKSLLEEALEPGMILRNHTYLKVYKCWRILTILKTPTIK